MDRKNLAHALVDAQSQMGTAPMNGYNPHFKNKFSTLQDLIDSTRDILTRNGLAITQYPDSDGTANYLVTKLKHISGEEEVSRALILLKDPTDIQKFGSAISYMKRYAYAAICGIATAELDDDGNSNGSHSAPAPTPVSSYRPQQNDQTGSTEVKSDSISPKQFGYLRAKIKDTGNPNKELEICRRYAVPSLDKLPWRKMQEVLDSLTGMQQVPVPTSTTAQFEEVMDMPF